MGIGNNTRMIQYRWDNREERRLRREGADCPGHWVTEGGDLGRDVPE